MQADIRDLNATNVVGYSGCKDNTFRYSIPWKTGAASYSKIVSRGMSKAEALLKVILSPVDSVADIYTVHYFPREHLPSFSES
ncbi:hypothetical protein L2E82_01407 [Cichorium intybus]|uniref:Uncharacterized protein n=1 Tax=Cichorium intybus TaxID=13427 RepID=A0ACB9GZX3_CICIN|nr:hypothetical protein L2E82_01407 [Cichorium intybus]